MLMLLSLESAQAAGAAMAVRAVSASRIANAMRFMSSPPISPVETRAGPGEFQEGCIKINAKKIPRIGHIARRRRCDIDVVRRGTPFRAGTAAGGSPARRRPCSLRSLVGGDVAHVAIRPRRGRSAAERDECQKNCQCDTRH